MQTLLNIADFDHPLGAGVPRRMPVDTLLEVSKVSLCVCIPCGKTSKFPPEVPVMPTVCRVLNSALHGQSLLIFCRGDTGLAPVPKFMCQACAVRTTGLYSQCEWGGKLVPLPGAARKARHPNCLEFLLTVFHSQRYEFRIKLLKNRLM